MSINDVVNKKDLFKFITGKDVRIENVPGINFKVKSRDVDRVYLAVKKMQRDYHYAPEHNISQYYVESFSNVEQAYLSKDIKEFNTAVNSLLGSIAYE